MSFKGSHLPAAAPKPGFDVRFVVGFVSSFDSSLVRRYRNPSAMIFLRLPSKKEALDHHNTAASSSSSCPFQSVKEARPSVQDRVVVDLESALLKSPSWFPYFMLVAIEAGSPLRGFLLLLSVPIAWLLRALLSPIAEMQLFALIALAGIKQSAVESVSRAVLAKFFLEDLHPETFRVFKACGERLIVTSLPWAMVQPVAEHYLEAAVVGSQVEVSREGYCTGRLKMVLGPANRAKLVQEHFKDKLPSIGIAGQDVDCGFWSLCEKSYTLRSERATTTAVVPKDYINPLVFHDGRLIHTPTPIHCLTILLWLPFAIPLALIRLIVGVALPKPIALPVEALLGVSIRVNGSPPPSPFSSKSSERSSDWKHHQQHQQQANQDQDHHKGVLFVCTHRSLLDPVFISFARMRNVTTVTYSVSRVSEVLSPIRTARLTRCRLHDAATMSELLDIGDLAVCPEGTTCREPFLLRFSALFAELTDRIVPVAVTTRLSMFHATTARGWKALDPLFFFMNPTPGYEVSFLQQIPRGETCLAGGRSSHEVANRVQRMLADALKYQCTNLTRKDKYRMLVGNDGLVSSAAAAASSIEFGAARVESGRRSGLIAGLRDFWAGRSLRLD